jgi:hypothetical protein
LTGAFGLQGSPVLVFVHFSAWIDPRFRATFCIVAGVRG